MAAASGVAAVEVIAVSKTYGSGPTGVVALDGVSLAIRDNEFFVLLGPSGCGKTTLLRCIAGFEALSAGRILLFDQGIDHLPPNRRPVNTVFQQYALFPHFTVADNVAFGLRMLKRDEGEVAATVTRMLTLVEMAEFADRHPAQLSGGQQQRVALARALASHPKVLLLDEPLSALDLKLRQSMREELKQLQEETGITFILVTHDQEEALTMGERVAVMSRGAIRQVGTPLEIYEKPVDHFVAGFIGETNFLGARIQSADLHAARCELANGARFTAVPTTLLRAGERVTVSIRPEKISLRAPAGDQDIRGIVERPTYLGTDTQYRVVVEGCEPLLVRVQNGREARSFAAGEEVGVLFDESACRVLEK